MKRFRIHFALIVLSLASQAAFSQGISLSGARQDASEQDSSQLSSIPNAQLAMTLPDYPVTAGDVYTLTYAAAGNAVKYVIPVDTSYKIRVANLGALNCEGMTYMQLKAQVESMVIKNYPLSGVQFVLTSPSTFIVSIVGEVVQTVEKGVWSLTRLSAVLEGILTDYASLRNITVTGINGSSKTYDLFKASRDGDLSQDPYLRPGDSIRVNRIDRRVTVTGAVERPGTYELLPGENIRELVERYGQGLSPQADTSRIELLRMLSGRSESGEKIYLADKDISSNYELLCYDSIYISSFRELKPVIFIEGAVLENSGAVLENSGAVLEATTRLVRTFSEGEDYAYFVRRNRGIFSANSDLEKAYVIRGGKAMAINLNPILYDAAYYADFPIEANDTLIIPFKQYFVSVAGAVKIPGRYPYIPDRTWEYYVGLAGGFVKAQNSWDAVDIVDIEGKDLAKTDVITPETTITAKTNSFLYYFGQYAPVITSILSIVSTTISIIAVTSK